MEAKAGAGAEGVKGIDSRNQIGAHFSLRQMAPDEWAGVGCHFRA